MKIECISCGREVNLDHKVFEDYVGPVKCFGCSAVMEIKTIRGFVDSLSLLHRLEHREAGAGESRC